MTAIRGYVAPTTEADALGAFARPVCVDGARCVSRAEFLRQFRPRRAARRQRARDQDLRSRSSLGLGCRNQQGQGAASFVFRLLHRGPAAAQRLASKGRGSSLSIRPGFESNGFWFRNHEGVLIEVKVGPKVSPDRKAESQWISVPAGVPGATTREKRRRCVRADFTRADFHARRIYRSPSMNGRLACACPTAPPISSRSCMASTAAIIISLRW